MRPDGLLFLPLATIVEPGTSHQRVTENHYSSDPSGDNLLWTSVTTSDTTTDVTAFTYNDQGQLTTKTLPRGVRSDGVVSDALYTVSYFYDVSGQVQEVRRN